MNFPPNPFGHEVTGAKGTQKPGNAVVKLTMRTVDVLSTADRAALFWERDLPGFGLRVYRTGRKVYIVQARGPAGSKCAVIGRHGDVRTGAAPGGRHGRPHQARRGPRAARAPRVR